MQKPNLLNNSNNTIQPVDRVGAYMFSRGICQKWIVIARVGYELIYSEVTVQHLSHLATETRN